MRSFYKSIYCIILLILFFSFKRINANIGNTNIITIPDYRINLINIRNPNGKLYAYIVLLFNENPHFVNLIQEDSITLQAMQHEGFHVVEYRNYIKSLRENHLKNYGNP